MTVCLSYYKWFASLSVYNITTVKCLSKFNGECVLSYLNCLPSFFLYISLLSPIFIYPPFHTLSSGTFSHFLATVSFLLAHNHITLSQCIMFSLLSSNIARLQYRQFPSPAAFLNGALTILIQGKL
jgi:hypothetical protein